MTRPMQCSRESIAPASSCRRPGRCNVVSPSRPDMNCETPSTAAACPMEDHRTTLESRLDILHEDSSCIVLNKPGGLLTQAPLGIDSLEFRIKRLLKERDNKPGGVYLGVPHRLD